MAKLSEVLGGIIKDLVQAQVSSDISSLEVVPHYRSDPILSNLEIPRFTLKNINLNLKFVVSSEAELNTVESGKASYPEVSNTITSEIIREILDSLPDLSIVDKKLIEKEFVIAFQERPYTDKMNILNPDRTVFLENSTVEIIKTLRSLPSSTKKKIIKKGNETSVNRLVKSIVEAKIPNIRKFASAKAALQRDLEILVEKTALENINAGQISELNISLTPDFMKILNEEQENRNT